MPADIQRLFAHRRTRMGENDVSRMLKVAEQPGIVSLAGGVPAPELYPYDEYRRAFEWVMETDGARALGYGAAEGFDGLREWVAQHLTRAGATCAAEDILITTGSQQGLDIAGKVFLDRGDQVVVENPTYVAALQAFDMCEPEYVVVPMDEDGMRVDALEQVLRDDQHRAQPRVKLVYAIPNFQNPTGRALSLERRRRLAELSNEFAIPVLEDDPYGALSYEGEPLPSVKSFDRAGTVIYLGTFSKVLSPGFRLGWMAATNTALFSQILYAKQPVDLGTSQVAQRVTYEVLKDGFLDGHLARIRAFYKERRDALLAALDDYFPPEARWTRPKGGLFVWVELPIGVDTSDLLLEAIDQERVAFVPGRGFHPDGSGSNTMRLNFSNVQPHELRDAVRRLAPLVRRHIQAAAVQAPAGAARS